MRSVGKIDGLTGCNSKNPIRKSPTAYAVAVAGLSKITGQVQGINVMLASDGRGFQTIK